MVAWRWMLCLVLCGGLAALEAQPQILCLHSYHKGPWTDELLLGYQAGLGDLSCELVNEYLDVKRDQSPEYLALMEQVLARKHHASRFSLVITSDDAAFRFALRLQDTMLGGAPVVFCGVNDWDPALISGHQRVTGVVERGDFVPTLALIRQTRPGLRTLHVLSDSTATAETNLAELRKAALQTLPGVELRVLRGLDLPDLAAKLRGAAPGDAAFFIAYWKGTQGQTLLPDELAPVLGGSAVPVFGRSEWMVGRGSVGGMCITGRAHGRFAGDVARRILRGESAADVPVFTGSTNEWLLDWGELERHAIDLSLIPAGARIINRPASLWADHRDLILATSAVIMALVALAVALAGAGLRERRARRALAAREGELKAIFAQSAHLAGMLDPQGRVVAVNAVAQAMAGVPQERLLGQWFWDCPWWSHDEAMRDRLRRSIGEAVQGLKVRFPTTHRDPQGVLRHIDFSLTVLRDGEGRLIGFLPEGRDITEQVRFEEERRTVEERLRASERLEALGQLAGGIAHDFNNQLAGILGFAELLAARTSDPQLKGYAAAIITAAENSAGLTRQMLAFARRGAVADAVIDVHRTITETATLLQAGLGQRIRLSLRLAASRCTVVGDATLLSNAILNLGLNARDAMPEGGSLTIATADDRLGDGPAVRLTVSDTGTGMTAEVQARIFEPFYTTKGPGRGTGLGLAAVHGTVLRCGGTITVSSAPGQGSSFIIHVPLAVAATPAPVLVAHPATLQGQALIIDDEASLRDLTSDLLTQAGMATQVADGGAAAARLAAAGGRWDLVVLDMLMPDMDGPATFAALRAHQPDLRILLVSGFVPEERLQPLLDAGRTRFLAKPFSAAALVAAAAGLLAEGEG
jgi:two-component system cell cycle sensor histidine kinase/response regulator CckA